VFGEQIIFVVYMILVTLLLVNMLIAMMGHTYETVNESQKEWYRQVQPVTFLPYTVHTLQCSISNVTYKTA